MGAAREGHEPVVATLLANKADVNTANKVSYSDDMYGVWMMYMISMTLYFKQLDSSDDNWYSSIVYRNVISILMPIYIHTQIWIYFLDLNEDLTDVVLK